MQAFAKFSGGAPYSGHAAHAYDGMVTLLKSVAAAKSRDGPSILAEMAKQKFQGRSAVALRHTSCWGC